MIEEGGTISGNVATLSDGPNLTKVPDDSVQATVPEPVEEKVSGLEDIRSASAFSRSQAGRRQG